MIRMAPLSSLGRIVSTHRALLLALTKRDLQDRFSGQILGLAWTLGHPLVLMLLYTFLFAFVFPARYATSGGTADYSPMIFAGLACWLTVQEVLARSPTVLPAHANLVKQIVFPTELLPLKTMLASSFAQVVTLTFALGYSLYRGTLTPIVLLLPVVVVVQLMAMAGASYLLASIGAYFRDLKDFIQVFLAVALFAQPILYNPAATPSWLQWVFAANPLSYLVWLYQDVLYFGHFAHPVAWVVAPLGSLLVLAVGYGVFDTMKHGLGDVL